jgi:hypothetical protein
MKPFEEIKNQMTDITAAFITVTRKGKQVAQAKVIDFYVDKVTAPMIEPVLAVYKEEGAPFLSTFDGVTSWVQSTQKIVAGDIGVQKKLEPVDAWKAFTPPSGDFSHAKPNITGNTIYTYSHQAYNWRTDDRIDAADFYAAYEIGAKYKSREAIYKYFGIVNKTEATC